MGKNTLGQKIKILIFILFSVAMQLGSAYAAVTADFSASVTSGCAPLVVKFTNKSTGGSTYLWRLGNGNTSTLKDPGGIYATAGTYTVTLIATDASGNIDSIVKKDYLTVFANPTANFKSDVRKGCAPLTVSFSDLSKKGSADITDWLWDFGDGNTSTKQNPQNTFTLTGNFDVTLIVKDKNGCTHNSTRVKYIVVPKKPTVSFKTSDSVACDTPLNVSFSSTSVSNVGGALKYSWDFGDGSTSSTLKSPKHKYTQAGSYNVTLTVTDTANCSATLIKSAFINIGREKPDFSFSPTTGCPPLFVNFKNLTSPGNPGSSYSWDFGDGQTSTDIGPTHSFASSGTFRIKLKVTSAAGCVDTMSKTITTLPQPKVSFSASDSISCHKPISVTFKNTSPNTKVIGWDFGDGHDTTSFESISHIYDDTGKYTVKLVVIGANGCTNTLVKSNFIKIAFPKDTFAAGPIEGCVPLKVTLKNYSTSLIPITSWKWDFGDGTTSTNKDPGTHTYTKEGKYKITLYVGNTKGCYDSFSVNVKAGTKPTANFSASPLKGCISDMMKVKFTNLSKNADSFFWNFDEVGTSTVKDPVQPYDVKKKKYSVTLTVWNKGCKDSVTFKDYIEILPPWANFKAEQSKCASDSVMVTDQSVGGDSIIYYFGDGDTSTKRNILHVYKSPGNYRLLQIAYNDSTKCIDSFFTMITVDPMVVSFTQDVTSGCKPLTVHFTSDVNKLARWEWNFGDGQTSTDPDPSHIYDTKGVFDVTLKVTSKVDSCVKIVKKTKLISTFGPEVKFGLGNSKGCTPLKVKLIDSTTSTKKIVSRVWNLGNGVTLPDTSPVMEYTYLTAPQDQNNGYTITLTVIDSGGCKQSLSKVAYPSHPRPDFHMEQEASCGSIKYRFLPVTDGSAGLAPLKYFWDIAGTDTSSQQAPEKVFFKTGIYVIKLTLTDANGCSDTVTKKLNIDIRFPVAKISAEPSEASCPPLLVKFKDESVPGLSGISKWFWDFGDGTHSELQNPEKVFLRPGHFTVKLIITDSVGCSDTIIGPDLVNIKGPTGTLTFDKDSGCVPLTVNFTVKSKNAYRYTWDMGDGNIFVDTDKPNLTHTYTNASSFIPSVTLMDSFGCLYHLPAEDTIVVHPLPISDFSFADFCFGYPTSFTNLSQPETGIITNWLWDFGDGKTSTDTDPKHIYTAPGLYTATLTVTNTAGCTNKTSKKLRIHGIDAQFSVNQPTGCIGKPLYFTDKSITDTNIVSWQWTFGDSASSTLQNPQHTYLKKGIYTVKLTTTDITGCSDTFALDKFIVGDTVASHIPMIYRVTVENNTTIELDFEKCREIDFYKYIIYRKDPGGSFKIIDSVLNPDDTVYFDKTVDALHKVYCYKVQVQNICGQFSKLINNEHCNVELTATPAINAAVLNWNFYTGWKVNKYEIYREDVYNKGSYYLIGAVNGNSKTYSDTSIICYRTHAYKVKAYEDSGFNQVSWSDTSVTTPIYVPHVPPTYVIRATVENNKEVKLEWNDLPRIKIKNFIVEKSEDGVSYKMLGTPLLRNVLSITDKNVDVNKLSYYYRLVVIDSCGDASPPSNLGKTILLKIDTTDNLRPQLHWTRYRAWPTGVRYYDIEQKMADGTFRKIGQTQSGNDSVFTDNITDLNSLPDYCYRVIAHRNGSNNNPDEFLNITSMSNEACTPIRSVLWVPNVFSPNEDSTNEKFYAVGLYIRKFEIKIFDRWGTRVYEGHDIHEGWDGKFRGDNPLMDAYKYIIIAQGIDGRNYYRTGWITVLP